MIEATILAYLKSALDVPVYMEIPKNPEEKMVILEKTGSGRTNRISQATIAIQSYGKTLYDAASLNEIVKKAMDDIIQLDDIGGIRLNSDYNFTNTMTEKYRYQCVYVVTYVE